MHKLESHQPIQGIENSWTEWHAVGESMAQEERKAQRLVGALLTVEGETEEETSVKESEETSM